MSETFKTCHCCGAQYTRAQWDDLRLVGVQDDYAGGCLILRDCSCKSTMSTPATLDDRDPNWAAFAVAVASFTGIMLMIAAVLS